MLGLVGYYRATSWSNWKWCSLHESMWC